MTGRQEIGLGAALKISQHEENRIWGDDSDKETFQHHLASCYQCFGAPAEDHHSGRDGVGGDAWNLEVWADVWNRKVPGSKVESWLPAVCCLSYLVYVIHQKRGMRL